jgi:hypothetical protein
MWIILLIVLAGIIILGVAIMILTNPGKHMKTYYRCAYKDPDKRDDEKEN